VSAPSTVTDTAELDPCSYCGTTAGVRQVTDTPPKVQGWSCEACGTEWAITVVNPVQRYLDHLAAAVELAAARSVLGKIITLADQVPVLTDEQLRFRLLPLAVCAAPRSHAPPRSTAGSWLSETSDSAPGGRPAPDSVLPRPRLATG
jgi:hypothetical protein